MLGSRVKETVLAGVNRKIASVENELNNTSNKVSRFELLKKWNDLKLELKKVQNQ